MTTKCGCGNVTFLVKRQCLLSQCKKLTNYLAHMQLQIEQDKKLDANPRTRKSSDRLGRTQEETSLRIEVFVLFIKQKK